MAFLLRISGVVDAINRRFGDLADWCILLSVLISAANAAVRYLFGYSSNAFLEIQWYLFGAAVLFGASYTLRVNEHVRVDIFYSRLSYRGQLLVDLFGLLVFLLPATVFFAWLSWPVFVRSYVTAEVSQNYGGLIRWPVMLVLPLGFALLTLQGLSEVIKRVGALRGDIVLETRYEQPVQ